MNKIRLIILIAVLFVAEIFAVLGVSAAEELAVSKKPRIAIIPLNIASSPYHFRKAVEGVSDLLKVDLYGAGIGMSMLKATKTQLPSAEGIDLGNYDLVCVLGGTPQSSVLTETLKNAKKKTRVVIESTGYVNYTGLKGNINNRKHPWINQYWNNKCIENYRRLLIYLGVKFCGLKAEVEKPIIFPEEAIYHPDAETIFTTLEEYLNWYGNKKGYRYDPKKLTIGLVFNKEPYTTENLEVEKALIKTIEKKNCNAIAMYKRLDFRLEKFFMKNGKTIVDTVICLTRLDYFNPEQGIETAKTLNVSLLKGIKTYYMSPEEWEKEPTGLVKHLAHTDIKREGKIEPMVISGKVVSDEGRRYNKPIDYQIDWRIERAIQWAKLHRKKNLDKKVAFAFKSAGGGKDDALGTCTDRYHYVPGTFSNLLKAMKEREYNLGDKHLPTKEELSKMMVEQASNIGVWAKGELKRRVKEGNAILISEEKYLTWFNELSEDKRSAVIEKFGKPPGKIMVYEEKGEKYLVIPKIEFGNVVIVPLPTPGWLQDKSTLYDEGALPPHHQYIAFWYWLNRDFKADLLLNVWTQIVEQTPGKEFGEPKYDWAAKLVQGLAPHLDPVPIHWEIGAGGGKVYLLNIDYMMTIVSSELYERLLDLEKKMSLYQKTREPVLKQEYKKGIRKECKRLHLDRDLKIDADSVGFSELFSKLKNYLDEVRKEHMPYGIHVMGETPEGKPLVEMITSMLGKEFNEHVAEINPQEGLSEKLVEKVIIDKKTPKEAQKDILGNISVKVTDDLILAMEYADRIDRCKQEIPRILDAFEGKYILPGPSGGPIRNPDALPTGRNPYAFDERTMPTKEAWEIGKKMVNQLLGQHLKKHGKYPQKVSFVLWHAEAMRQHGIMEAEIFYLLGVRPIWNIKGRVEDVELIPRDELKRPRIDILVTTSNAYKCNHMSRIRLIDKAVRLVSSLNETSNYVQENVQEIEKELINKGYEKSQATHLSKARVFSTALGTGGVGLHNSIGAGNTWENDGKISEHYIGRMGYLYGQNEIGVKAKELLRENLKAVEVGVFSRSSNVLGMIDDDQPAAFFGGLEIAVRNTTGKEIDMYITNTRTNVTDPGKCGLESLDHFFNRELRARNFNPKWIKGMMEQGRGGATYMKAFTENLWMWDVTSPHMVTEDMWNEVNDIYINDKYDLKLQEYFDKNNPYALQDMISTMLEVREKGYWHPTKEVLEKLAKIYAESIAKHGVSGSYGSTDPSLHKDVSKLLSAMPDVKPELIKKYQEKVAMATVELEEVKGYEMKELKEKKEEKLSTTKVVLGATLIILLIMLVVGRGLWKGMRRQQ